MTRVKIDFVSDVSCPWCAVGLASLESALGRLAGEVEAELRFQPFELNPHMPAGGQDIEEHLTQKYGSTPERAAGLEAVVLKACAKHPGDRFASARAMQEALLSVLLG